MTEGSVWCRSCPYLLDAVPEATSPDDHKTAPEGFQISERVLIERRLMATERMVAAALPRNEFLMFVETSKDAVARFHTVTFQPVAVRSVAALVISCIGLVISLVLLLLVASKMT